MGQHTYSFLWTVGSVTILRNDLLRQFLSHHHGSLSRCCRVGRQLPSEPAERGTEYIGSTAADPAGGQDGKRSTAITPIGNYALAYTKTLLSPRHREEGDGVGT